MKYCLKSRQNKKYLALADEIFVECRDYRQVSDLFIEYPDKMIILEITNEKFEEEESTFMNIVEEYSKISNNFCCCIYNLKQAMWFIEHEIKYYYGYPVSTFYDVRALAAIGVEYIKVTAPLTFQIPNLAKFDTKFRMVPNVAYDAYIPRNDGICGQWVRPEDIEHYENGIYVFEFENANLEKERTLHHIYAEEKVWNGNLNLLITNLNINADNRAMPDEFGAMRSTCGQRCMVNGACHFCATAFKFEEMLRKIKRERDLEKKAENASQEEN